MNRPAHDGRRCVWIVVLLLLGTWAVRHSRADDVTDNTNSRQKRLLWITTDGRLALPPGTELTITPSLSLPFVRHPPDGFMSHMSISLPFTSEPTGLIIELKMSVKNENENTCTAFKKKICLEYDFRWKTFFFLMFNLKNKCFQIFRPYVLRKVK